MTSDSTAKLREIQKTVETAASTATTRAELINLRAIWGQIQSVLDSENDAHS